MSDAITLRRILSEAIRLGRSSPKITLLSLGIVFFGYLAPDLLMDQETAPTVYWPVSLIVLYLQLLLTASVLPAAGIRDFVYNPRSPTRGRFPAAFGLQLFYAVSVVAGLLLLVVPGLVLLVRWSLCVPIILGENATITGSLRRSWVLTRHHWKIVAVSTALPFLLFLLFAVPALLEYPDYGKPPAFPVTIVNAVSAISWVGSWLITAALYGLIRGRDEWETTAS